MACSRNVCIEIITILDIQFPFKQLCITRTLTFMVDWPVTEWFESTKLRRNIVCTLYIAGFVFSKD